MRARTTVSPPSPLSNTPIGRPSTVANVTVLAPPSCVHLRQTDVAKERRSAIPPATLEDLRSFSRDGWRKRTPVPLRRRRRHGTGGRGPPRRCPSPAAAPPAGRRGRAGPPPPGLGTGP